MTSHDRQRVLQHGSAGRVARREFLRFGLAGLTSLSLPGLLRLRAQAALPQKTWH